MGNFYILTSHKPLTTQEEIFKALSFVSCKAILKPQHFNPEITIDSATTKNESYCWIFNDIAQIQHFNYLYGNVKRNYPDQRVSSVYQYAFRPIVDKKVLADLKYNNYENKSILLMFHDQVLYCIQKPKKNTIRLKPRYKHNWAKM